MRNKIHSILTLMLFMVSTRVNAQITALSQLSNNKAYTLTCSRGTLSTSSSDYHLTSTYNNTTYTAQSFALVSYNGSYYLYSTVLERFINSSGVATNYTPTAVTLTDQGSGEFLMVIGSNGVNVTNTSDGYQVVVNSWVTADAGNVYTITEAESFDATAALAALASPQTAPTTTIASLSDLSNSKSYMVGCARGTWYIADGATSMSANTSVAPDVPGNAFGIICEDDTYFIYNVNAGKFLTSSNTLSDSPQIVSITSTGDSTYPFFFKFDDTHIINMNSVPAIVINSWSTVDEGNQFAIIELESCDLTAATTAVHNYLHPASITYTVNVVGGVGGTVTVNGTTYHNGDSFSVSASNALTTSDVTVNTPTNYLYQDLSVAETGDERIISVRIYYDVTNLTQVTTLESLSNTKGYVISNANGMGVMVMNPDYSESLVAINNLIVTSYDGRSDVTTSAYFNAYDPTDLNQVWQIASDGEQYYFYNVGQNKYLFFNESDLKYEVSSDKVAAQKVVVNENGSIGFNFHSTPDTYTWYYATSCPWYATGPIAYWYSTDDGAQWNIYEVTSGLDDPMGFADYTELRSLLTKANAVVLGSGLCEYTEATSGTLAAAIATGEAIDQTVTSGSYQTTIDAAVSALNAAIDALILNRPTQGKYYRLKGAGSGKYISAEDAGSSNLNSLSDTADATNIFLLTDENKLLSYYNPTYLSGTLDQYYPTYLTEPSSTDGFVLDFQNGSTEYMCKYNIAVSDTLYLYDWAYTWTGASVLVSNEPDDIRCHWVIENVDELPVALTPVEDFTIATLYLPVPVTISGASVFTASLDNGELAMSEITTGIVPANTAVILIGDENATTATATITTSAATATTGLSGTSTHILTSEVQNPYVLAYHNGVLGFFRFTGEYLSGNRAYYAAGDASVEAFTIRWDTDGISNVNTTNNADKKNVYDLMGRQMSNTKLPKGIYIQGGKKFIVK